MSGALKEFAILKIASYQLKWKNLTAAPTNDRLLHIPLLKNFANLPSKYNFLYSYKILVTTSGFLWIYLKLLLLFVITYKRPRIQL